MRFRLPGTKEFVLLTELTAIPNGTEIDARKGRLLITVLHDASGQLDGARFYAGRFIFRQGKGATPLTTLKLTGGSFKNCSAKASGARHPWLAVTASVDGRHRHALEPPRAQALGRRPRPLPHARPLRRRDRARDEVADASTAATAPRCASCAARSACRTSSIRTAAQKLVRAGGKTFVPVQARRMTARRIAPLLLAGLALPAGAAALLAPASAAPVPAPERGVAVVLEPVSGRSTSTRTASSVYRRLREQRAAARRDDGRRAGGRRAPRRRARRRRRHVARRLLRGQVHRDATGQGRPGDDAQAHRPVVPRHVRRGRSGAAQAAAGAAAVGRRPRPLPHRRPLLGGDRARDAVAGRGPLRRHADARQAGRRSRSRTSRPSARSPRRRRAAAPSRLPPRRRRSRRTASPPGSWCSAAAPTSRAPGPDVPWVEIFAVLLVSHVVGDFLLQTDWQATHKREGLGSDPERRRALVSHTITLLALLRPGARLARRRPRRRRHRRARGRDLHPPSRAGRRAAAELVRARRSSTPSPRQAC